MQKSRMTDVIYDYFTSRILFGYYLPGDRLPSIQYICRQFEVSALTVRAALSRMREEGYISTAERRRSTVSFRPDERRERQYRHSFLSRRQGMEDLCRNSILLFDPIVRFYLKKQNEASVGQIRAQLKKRKGHPAKQVIMFYAEAMRPLNNPLALNLYWEMVRYLRTPYLTRPADFEDADAQAEDHIEQMLLLIEAGKTDEAVDVMQAFDRGVTQRFFQCLSVELDTAQPVEQVPFQWQVYWEHPQLCYTLAAELMAKIDERVYRQGEFLPSCQTLAQEYGVSLITMRRTLELLGMIRVTETENGLGTRVISGKAADPPDFSHPQIRKSLLLFLQAMQIGALTCEKTAADTLSSLDDGDFQALDREIGRQTAAGAAFLLGETGFRLIAEKSPSAFIREVYQKLCQLLQWGHALHIFYQKPTTGRLYERYADKLREALRRRDAEGFARCFSELMAMSFRISRKLLLELGFPEDQLV